jgi:hypothetical protein
MKNQHEEVVENDFEDEKVTEEAIPDKLTTKDKREKLFGNQDKDPNRPLQEFLDEFKITEAELRNITRQYKDGYAIPATQSVKAKQDISVDEAKKLAESGKNEIKTTNVLTAENLVKEHGYKVITVQSGPPKTWVLQQ